MIHYKEQVLTSLRDLWENFDFVHCTVKVLSHLGQILPYFLQRAQIGQSASPPPCNRQPLQNTDQEITYQVFRI